MTCPRCEGSVLELQDVWYSYGRRPVLEGVSLEVPAGSFAALIGPNGAGKSTLLRLLLGILTPQKGTVSLFDQPPGKHGEPIGYVPQGINLPRGFPLSVEDVVLMGRYGMLGPIKRPSKEDRHRVAESLDQVRMAHLSGQRFEDLSGGQQQRVLIARAMVSDPCLLILDEPTSGLDPAARARFYGQVCDLQRARGLTLFCASHDVEDVAQHAQQLILLDHSVRASGPPQDVLKSQAVPEVYHFPPPHVHIE
ncbi:MAG: metal ABC transporter ATP-binding protein, partial [Gemmatimonadetes bacterium]|nr:metal ABC transporter ATP-binding protein [Gemmatimonadota bacterium]